MGDSLGQTETLRLAASTTDTVALREVRTRGMGVVPFLRRLVHATTPTICCNGQVVAPPHRRCVRSGPRATALTTTDVGLAGLDDARAGNRGGLNPARTGPVQPSRLGDDSAFDLVHGPPIIEHTFDESTN